MKVSLSRSTARIIAVVALFALVALALVGCGGADAGSTTTTTLTPETGTTVAPSEEGTPTEDVTELKIEDLKVGTGAEAVAGKTVTVEYTGWLTDGSKFDSSYDSGQPFTFQLGAGQVIPGWDQGVAGMKIGGQRRLIIPPQLAYGESGASDVIPPNSTLVFEVELLAVQ